MLVSAGNGAEISEILENGKYSTSLAGPALGRDKISKGKVSALLESGKPVVLDADALTIWENDVEELFSRIRRKPKRPVILTPHEGEFRKVFKNHSFEDRVLETKKAAEISGAYIVLKGANTVIADNVGKVVLNNHSSPYLATAGSGDVLAGMIIGLVTAGMPVFEAICAAVWIHGEAGIRFGPGLISEDLPDAIPSVLSTLVQ